MNDATNLLQAVEQGDRQAAAELMPLVYGELHALAAAKLAAESPGHTLCATALVHEAFLRLVGGGNRGHWDHRRQFLAAAAEAMRRILVDHARKKRAEKRGGHRERIDLDGVVQSGAQHAIDWIDIDDALSRLAVEDADAAELVRLKLYAGVSIDEAADLLGVSRATAYRDWTYARAWLREALEHSPIQDAD